METNMSVYEDMCENNRKLLDMEKEIRKLIRKYEKQLKGIQKKKGSIPERDFQSLVCHFGIMESLYEDVVNDLNGLLEEN